MRLRQIRISGFKSFADLTTIEIPSSIVGIVGPNGCGKSNVIEAVRWALGEGKASDLRCKSMSELIFAGADNRKPAGRAMVELVFDNSDKTLQGPWGAYTDISVKRILTRDNTSSYLINNQQVRATDVRELFMGTGLGANSYAIISQGMVTEFAKDSPEKRREYLEEAAGVSKYKKRRKEAENRLATTRANLERVTDLQITRKEGVKRLEEEAQVALRYRELESRRTERESLWWFTQMVESQNSIDKINLQISQAQAEISKNDEDSRQKRDALATLRNQHNAANIEVLGKTQALGEVERSISAVEGSIRSIIERRALMKTQLESYRTMLASREAEITKQAERMKELAAQREEKEIEVEGSGEREMALEEALAVAEEKADTARSEFERLQEAARGVEHDARALSLEMASLTKSREEVSVRLEKFRREAAQTEAPDEGRYEALKEELEALREESEGLAIEREESQAMLEDAREKLAATQGAIHTKEQRQAAIGAKLTTLHELEEKTLGADKLTEWLERQGLTSLARLFEKIHVEPAWARALEAVLRERVNALGVSRLQMAAGFALVPPPAKLTFYLTQGTQNEAVLVLPAGLTGLIDKLTFDHRNEDTKAVLSVWLSRYAVADSIEDAGRRVGELPAGCHFVTPEGHVIDAMSVNYWADDATGLLSRRAEIATLEAQEGTLREELEVLHRDLGTAHMSVSEATSRLQSINTRFEIVRKKESDTALEVTRLSAAISAYRNRSRELGQWIEEAQAQLEDIAARLIEAEEDFAAIDERVAAAQQKSEDARLSYERAQQTAKMAAQEKNVFEYTKRELALSLQTISQQITDAGRAQQLAQNEKDDLTQKIEEVTASLEELDEDSARAGLTQLTQAREAAQVALEHSKVVLEDIAQQVATLEAGLGEFEDKKREAQNRVSELFGRRQQFEIEHETVRRRLEELEHDEEALRVRYETERPKLNSLRREVEDIAKQMAELGAVNHAALEQLKVQTEEVERIDREVADLEQAIVTIEAAIKKIDHETRALLMDTFNRVNEAFNQKFTQLFKGGHARLEMTSDDALEAGLEMYANPPGKHNHSIRQLSGGELTLTAIALVFAFFTLNPAPFCLLDEIDAPLDEANQERLSRLVGAMSENTQFMMITHHRVTMEHTNQLVGVTMKEPGVSRVVSVDIAEASQYAQKAPAAA